MSCAWSGEDNITIAQIEKNIDAGELPLLNHFALVDTAALSAVAADPVNDRLNCGSHPGNRISNNNRPRKALGRPTPAEVFHELCSI